MGFDDSLIADGEYDIIIDLELDSEDTEVSEEDALSKALDDAFSNLTGERLESKLSDEEFSFGGVLDHKSQELDELTSGMIEKGQVLDLDLSFLKDILSSKTKDPESF
jgi:hypothetical protein